MKFADVGNKIFVGDYKYCDCGVWKGRAVHVGHEYQNGVGLCSRYAMQEPEFLDGLSRNTIVYHLNGSENQVYVRYCDGEHIDKFILDTLYHLFKSDDDVLVHCAAGQTRSPTLALFGKMVRGRDLIGSIGDITRALRDQYPKPTHGLDLPPFFEAPLRSIVEYIDNHK